MAWSEWKNVNSELTVSTELSKSNNGMSVVKSTNIEDYSKFTLISSGTNPSVFMFRKANGTYENVTLNIGDTVDISEYVVFYENFYNGALQVGYSNTYRIKFS